MHFHLGLRGAAALGALIVLADCSTCGLPAGACTETADCPFGFGCDPLQHLCVVIRDGGIGDAPTPDAVTIDQPRPDVDRPDIPGADQTTGDSASADRALDAGASDRPIDDASAQPDSRTDAAGTDSTQPPADAGPPSDAGAVADRPTPADAAPPPDASSTDRGCVIGWIQPGAAASRLAVAGNDLFVASSDLKSYRFSNGFGQAATDSEIFQGNSINDFVDVVLDDTGLATADGQALYYWSNRDATNLAGAAQVLNLYPTALALYASHIYTAASDAAITPVDRMLRTPGSSRATNPPFNIRGLSVSGSLLHAVGQSLTASGPQYQAFALTEPASPAPGLSKTLLPASGASCSRVAVAGDTVFTACGSSGLLGFSYRATPSTPAVAVSLDATADVTATDQAVYAAGALGLARYVRQSSGDFNPNFFDGAGRDAVAVAVHTTSHVDDYAFLGLPSGLIAIIDLQCAF